MKWRNVRPGREKRALVVRLRKIKGQIEGIEKRIQCDAACSDVLMQAVAARRALKSFNQKMIEFHLHDCIENAATQSESRQHLRSLLTVLMRYVGEPSSSVSAEKRS